MVSFTPCIIVIGRSVLINSIGILIHRIIDNTIGEGIEISTPSNPSGINRRSSIAIGNSHSIKGDKISTIQIERKAAWRRRSKR
jgi:hypothetical protein